MGNEALHQTLQQSFPTPTDIDWMMILPMVIVALTGLVALIIEVARPKRDNGPMVLSSLIGLLAAGAAVVMQYNAPSGTAFAGTVMRDSVSSRPSSSTQCSRIRAYCLVPRWGES